MPPYRQPTQTGKQNDSRKGKEAANSNSNSFDALGRTKSQEEEEEEKEEKGSSRGTKEARRKWSKDKRKGSAPGHFDIGVQTETKDLIYEHRSEDLDGNAGFAIGTLFITGHHDKLGDRPTKEFDQRLKRGEVELDTWNMAGNFNAGGLTRTGITTCPSHQRSILKDRPFIILFRYATHYTCIPLFTYAKQGSRHRVDEYEHVSVFDSRKSHHAPGVGRQQSIWKPLQVQFMNQGTSHIDPRSSARITHPMGFIKHAAKDKVGQLDLDSIRRLQDLFHFFHGHHEKKSEQEAEGWGIFKESVLRQHRLDGHAEVGPHHPRHLAEVKQLLLEESVPSKDTSSDPRRRSSSYQSAGRSPSPASSLRNQLTGINLDPDGRQRQLNQPWRRGSITPNPNPNPVPNPASPTPSDDPMDTSADPSTTSTATSAKYQHPNKFTQSQKPTAQYQAQGQPKNTWASKRRGSQQPSQSQSPWGIRKQQQPQRQGSKSQAWSSKKQPSKTQGTGAAGPANAPPGPGPGIGSRGGTKRKRSDDSTEDDDGNHVRRSARIRSQDEGKGGKEGEGEGKGKGKEKEKGGD